jgi:hypothetical protein
LTARKKIDMELQSEGFRRHVTEEFVRCRNCEYAMIRLERGMVVDDKSPICVDCMAVEEFVRRNRGAN